jgi:hypothetical protein
MVKCEENESKVRYVLRSDPGVLIVNCCLEHHQGLSPDSRPKTLHTAIKAAGCCAYLRNLPPEQVVSSHAPAVRLGNLRSEMQAPVTCVTLVSRIAQTIHRVSSLHISPAFVESHSPRLPQTTLPNHLARPRTSEEGVSRSRARNAASETNKDHVDRVDRARARREARPAQTTAQAVRCATSKAVPRGTG